MVQLILTLIAIALAAAAALVTVNYTPWWAQSVAESEAGVRTSLRKLETVYIAAARAASPAGLSPNGDADGGLMANFGSYLGFTPAAPTGYTWTYGKKNASGAYANMDFFCLQPDGTIPGRYELAARALQRAAQGNSPEQFVLGTACGATSNQDFSTAGVPVLTFYVKSLPDVGL